MPIKLSWNSIEIDMNIVHTRRKSGPPPWDHKQAQSAMHLCAGPHRGTARLYRCRPFGRATRQSVTVTLPGMTCLPLTAGVATTPLSPLALQPAVGPCRAHITMSPTASPQPAHRFAGPAHSGPRMSLIVTRTPTQNVKCKNFVNRLHGVLNVVEK